MGPEITEKIEVPNIVSDKECQFFIENGYLVVPNLLSDKEIEELRQDTVTLARGEYECDNMKPLPDSVTDEEAIGRILCIHQPHFVSETIEKYVKHPKICGILSQITAAHLPFWDGSVKCMQSMLFVKPPNFQGQAWHQDEIYIPTRDRSLIGAWIAMDDATVENGCLWVLPGSHRQGYLYPQRNHENPDEFDFAQESYGFDGSEEVPVEVTTGTLVFFNGYLLHRSRKNRGNTFRRVLVNHYCNSWSLLPWSIREGERPASADRRCIIPVSGVDPYSWKGYDDPPKSIGLRTCKAINELPPIEAESE
ncbi:phytanoyl-CoA dioxygenase [Candidatus Poribacteria bacterium]|nr:MAG: phytanoyl-CoA dioxygenase [Candidatus Poribacteria bacterium]